MFPGLHERADFVVEETGDEIAVAFRSRDGKCTVDAAVVVSDELIGSQLFASTAAASDFFRAGSAGFSPRRRGRVLDGLELQTDAWTIEPTLIGHVASSMFDDATVFPLGTIELDSALVMRGVPVEWHGVGSIPCGDGPRELSPN